MQLAVQEFEVLECADCAVRRTSYSGSKCVEGQNAKLSMLAS